MGEAKLTVVDILQSVSDQMCDKYCKWPEKCLEETGDQDEAEELLLTEHCAGCPMLQLI